MEFQFPIALKKSYKSIFTLIIISGILLNLQVGVIEALSFEEIDPSRCRSVDGICVIAFLAGYDGYPIYDWGNRTEVWLIVDFNFPGSICRISLWEENPAMEGRWIFREWPYEGLSSGRYRIGPFVAESSKLQGNYFWQIIFTDRDTRAELYNMSIEFEYVPEFPNWIPPFLMIFTISVTYVMVRKKGMNRLRKD